MNLSYVLHSGTETFSITRLTSPFTFELAILQIHMLGEYPDVLPVNYISFTLWGIPYASLLQVRMAIDIGVPDAKAALLPGYMSLAQSIGKIVLGKLATFPRADKIVMYQVALLANCLATTLCPIITNYTGLIIYAIVFGMADGCTSANNMLVVGDLVGRKLLSKGYSMFLLTSAASFLIGPPTAGKIYL